MIEKDNYDYQEALQISTNYFGGDELAAKVFLDKYALKDSNKNILESSPSQMHRRMAKEFARIEKNKFSQPLSEDEIFSLLDKFQYVIPQGSQMFGIGNNYQVVSLSNCYVLETPEDSYAGILKTDQQLVQICKRRGGVGIDLSKLRPAGAPTKNAATSSTGIESWMERYSNSIREVAQNGRRGALMETIDVRHPDIEKFISIKNDPLKVTGANISVRLSDDFLNAVDNNLDFQLQWPVDSKTPVITKLIKARELWEKIIHSAWLRAEPGLLFWSNIIKNNAIDCYKDLGFASESTNPCCLSVNEDYYVVTQNGVKEIKTITSEDLIWLDKHKIWVKTSGYFKSGLAKVKKITLSNNESFVVSENHKWLKVEPKRVGTKISNEGYSLEETKNLLVGDKIAVHTNEVTNVSFGLLGTLEEGLIMGWMCGDGFLSYKSDADAYPAAFLDFWVGEFDVAEKIHKIVCELGYPLDLQNNTRNGKKTISSTEIAKDFVNKYQYNIWKFKSESLECDFLWKCSENFFKGFLSAYFSADGTVECIHRTKCYTLQLTNINLKRLNQIKYILNIFGIKSSVGLNKEAGEATFRGKTFKTKNCYRLSITGIDNIKQFRDKIGCINDRKLEKINEICSLFQPKFANKCRNYCVVKSIEDAGVEEVGCINVEGEHYFTVNGVLSGNSELPLCPFDSCRLLVQNLYSYVNNPFTNNSKFDHDLFYKHVKISQRLMDDVVDLEIEKIDKIIEKIKNDPEAENIKREELYIWEEIKKKCQNGRRTGLGITGTGDMLAALNIKYGSEESIQFVEQVHKNQKLASFESSMEMAREIGAFPIWNWDLEKDSAFLLKIRDENLELYQNISKYGRRNIGNLTIAPAGSVSLLTQTSSGVEPLFMLQPYIRRKKVNPNDTNARVDFIDPNGDAWQEFEVYHPKVKLWMEITGEKDLNKSPWFGCCAEDIDWKNRVKLQAAAQKHIDHAISSTLNLPENVTEEKVAEIYETAWKSGCKGITIYRKNCRTGVLVEKQKQDNNKKCILAKRPRELNCDIYHCRVKGQEYFCIISLDKCHRPYEIFAGKNGIIPKNIEKGVIQKLKRGYYQLFSEENLILDNITSFLTEDGEALTRMISMSLRHTVNLEYVVDQLIKVEGDLTSLSKVMARCLKKYIEDGTAIGHECPECNQKSLSYESGCKTCKNCGWTACQ